MRRKVLKHCSLWTDLEKLSDFVSQLQTGGLQHSIEDYRSNTALKLFVTMCGEKGSCAGTEVLRDGK